MASTWVMDFMATLMLLNNIWGFYYSNSQFVCTPVKSNHKEWKIQIIELAKKKFLKEQKESFYTHERNITIQTLEKPLYNKQNPRKVSLIVAIQI